MAPVHKELLKYKHLVKHKIIHTGQHYDIKMSDVFFRELELPEPDINLGVGSSSHSVQTAKIMLEFEKVVLKEKPDLVIVYGDVNSTIAAGLVCSKIVNRKNKRILTAHIESGLRSNDMTMPEEINRILTDNIADFLFITEKSGMDNLLKTGFERKKLFFVGNTMIDSLKGFLKKIRKSKIIEELCISRNKYITVTIHRPSNVDSRNNLLKISRIFSAINKINPELDIVFSVHPRTVKMMRKFKLESNFYNIKNLILTNPFGYLDFLKLISQSKFVLTDSGGIQEETTFLKIPCLTLRENTERPVTIRKGTNTLCGLDEKLIIRKIREIENNKYKKGKNPLLWDGKSSRRIAKVLISKLKDEN